MRGEAGDAEEEAHHEVGSAARFDVHPDGRTSVGIRSVPRMTPTAPPRAPMPSRPRPRARAEAVRAPAADGPQRQVDAAPHEDGRDRGEEQVLGDVVGDERAGDRADDRRRRHPGDDPPVDPPARAWLTAPEAAAAAEIAMFVPAAASGLPVSATIRGSRSVPSTSPSIEPT